MDRPWKSHWRWNPFTLQLFRCYKRKVCYPTWKRWVFLLIPGTLIAGAGLIIFTFFETESNYKHTHSAWHACISISIVFLLPPRKTDRTGKITRWLSCKNLEEPSMNWAASTVSRDSRVARSSRLRSRRTGAPGVTMTTMMMMTSRFSELRVTDH